MRLVTEDDAGRLDDQQFAQWLAGRAGEALTALRDRQGFADPRALKDAGDRASHHRMTAAQAR
ncbi:hypothetical protein GCM10027452_32530 [Micromonospora halotolerans]